MNKLGNISAPMVYEHILVSNQTTHIHLAHLRLQTPSSAQQEGSFSDIAKS